MSISRDSSHEGGLVRNWLCTVSSPDLLQLALLERDGCMTVESNFTQHCLTLLSTRQLQVFEQGAYRVLPRPSDQEVQKCIWRMSKWADMAKAVVEAEFPDFLVVTDLFVFASAVEEKAVAAVAVKQTHCQRLAKLCSVDAQALACQLARHRTDQQTKPSRTSHNAAIKRPGRKQCKGSRRYEPSLG